MNTYRDMAAAYNTLPVSQAPRMFYRRARMEDGHTRVFWNV